jgi:hypothetical protein
VGSRLAYGGAHMQKRKCVSALRQPSACVASLQACLRVARLSPCSAVQCSAMQCSAVQFSACRRVRRRTVDVTVSASAIDSNGGVGVCVFKPQCAHDDTTQRWQSTVVGSTTSDSIGLPSTVGHGRKFAELCTHIRIDRQLVFRMSECRAISPTRGSTCAELVLWSGRDRRGISPTCGRFQRLLPRSGQLTPVNSARHALWLFGEYQPHSAVATLLDWLNSHKSPASPGRMARRLLHLRC